MPACKSRASNKRVTIPAGWRGTQSLPGRIQLVLDWYHRMTAKGHNPATAFATDIHRVNNMYHQLKDIGAVHPADVMFLDHKITAWSIRAWEYKHYPELKGSAPVPPRPSDVKEVFQDFFDWWTHAHPAFERADFVVSVYHQYQRTGKLTAQQEAAVRKIAKLRAVRDWHAAHAGLKGTGVAPAKPDEEGYMFVDSDDDK